LKYRDFVVIGSGPAALGAAATASSLGVETTLIGEDAQIGGQIFRQMATPLKVQEPLAEFQNQKLFRNLKREISTSKVQCLNKTLVWNIFDDRIIATDDPRDPLIQAKKILIAEGAYEAPVAFPGWTLPGVMTLGGVQILLKSQGVIPKGRVLIAGTGPLLYLTASQLLKNGADIIGILEASSFSEWIRNSVPLWRSLDLLGKGVGYLAGLKKRQVPISFGAGVKEALGSDGLEEVVVSRMDKSWSPILGTERKLKADVLCFNFGFIPSTSFTHLAKCQHACDLHFRGWSPTYTSRYETSRESIFVAGDGTAIGGVKMAVIEGRIVGTEVARQLGLLSEVEAGDRCLKLQKALSRQQWYRDFMRKTYAYRAGLLAFLTDETIVCRCEEVKLKTINQIIEEGSCHIEKIKRLTRLGMGRCQGRFCHPTLLGILAQRLSFEEMITEDFSGRPPVKPMPLRFFSEMASSALKTDETCKENR